ncbi:7807_t:CDS:2 [Ambispora gerdemannii]|uniref:7807_t:CDS:1 n=1 Tax=Ambispora gerdemannii TaxID=144530 RepID=A0A9N9GQE0_9GLOM|nr:7807_t:CDS:2 [Ambispora gerdemannii]
MEENTQLKVKVTKLESDFLEIKKRTQTITNTHEVKLQIPDSSLDYSEETKSRVSNSLQVTSLPIGEHSVKETLSHCETKDSVTTNITPVTPVQIGNSSDSAFNSESCSEKVRPKVPLEQNQSVSVQKHISNPAKLSDCEVGQVQALPEETKVLHDYIVAQDFIQEVSSGFTDEDVIEVIDGNLILTTNTTIEVELAHFETEKVRPKVPLEQNHVVNSVSNTKSTNFIGRSDMTKKTSLTPQVSAPPIFEPEVKVSIPSASQPKKTPSKKQINRKNNHTDFRKKTLEQYPDIFYEFNDENIDYYRITDETLCPLCKLDHDDEEGIKGEYKDETYYIKCEQHEIQITA